MGAIVLQQAVATWSDYAGDLLRMVFALGFVCAIAWITLRFAAARGLGKSVRGRRLEVIERLALDAQRSLLIVRVEQRRLLIGVGTGAAPQLVAELDGDGAAVIGASGVSTEELARVRDAVRRDATH